MRRLVLASGSPRRRELLTQMGLSFEIVVPEIDESRRGREAPRTYVRRLAEEKAQAVAVSRKTDLVMAADTTVVLDGEILGKPGSRAEARRMLTRLSGRTHRVLTAVALAERGAIESFVAASRVHFDELRPAEIRRYVQTEEPMDKAGSYAIQGRGAAFVRGVTGSVTNVIGLPLAEVRVALQRRGFIP